MSVDTANSNGGTGNQTYSGAVTGTGLTLTTTALSTGNGVVTANNASNDFSGTLSVNSKGSVIRDVNSLNLVLNDLANSTITTGGLLTVSGNVTDNFVANVTGPISFGAMSVGGFLDATAAGNITQTGLLSVTGNLWALTTVGNIDLGGYHNVNNVISLTGFTNHLGGTVSLIAPTDPTPLANPAVARGSDVSLKADSIRVGTVRPLDGSTTNVGITAARVTISVPVPAGNGGPSIQADGLEGLITANTPFDPSAVAPISALTIIADGQIGNSNTVNPTTEGLRVATSGSVTVVTDAAGVNTVNLVGDQAVQPKYANSGVLGKRSVKYNGVEATSSQLNAALDAAYLDIRNLTTEIRESGFAKENAAKTLRRGVVTSAGPGQPAVDDSTGLAQLESCDGSFGNEQIICQ